MYVYIGAAMLNKGNCHGNIDKLLNEKSYIVLDFECLILMLEL